MATTTLRNTTLNHPHRCHRRRSNSNSINITHSSNSKLYHTTPSRTNKENEAQEEEEGRDLMALLPALILEVATKPCQEAHVKAACIPQAKDQQQPSTLRPFLLTEPLPSTSKYPFLPPSFPLALLPSLQSERARH